MPLLNVLLRSLVIILSLINLSIFLFGLASFGFIGECMFNSSTCKYAILSFLVSPLVILLAFFSMKYRIVLYLTLVIGIVNLFLASIGLFKVDYWSFFLSFFW